jgi:hypothetical protein
MAPLPVHFFEPLVLDAFRQLFVSFSTTLDLAHLGPAPLNGPKHLKGSLHSWVPLKSLIPGIVVSRPDDSERARQASYRDYFPPTASTSEIALLVFRGTHMVLIPV